MQVIVDNNPVFAKAHEKFENFTKNDELVEFYEAHQKWVLDRDTAIGYAEMKGIEQGLEQGIEQGIEQTAVGMIKKNMKTPDISEITGLNTSKIEELRKLKD